MVRSLLVLALVCASTAAEAAERRYAVVIGNDRGARSERPLSYAERDALRFSEVMRQYGGVAAENNVVLLGETSKSIRRALLEVNARIRAESVGSDVHTTLVVYYSGHASERGLHLGGDRLGYDELRAIMRGSPATVRLLVLDACRSGGVTNVKGGRPADEFEVTASVPLDVEGVVMITSSAAGEDSHESDRLGASFFSHHLTNALIGAGDEDGDRAVTLTEAYAYAYRNTLRTSGHATTLQHPTYAYDLKGRGDLVMTRLPRDAEDAAALELGEAGFYLVLDDGTSGDVVAELRAPRDDTRVVLKPSRYLVQRRDEDHYLEYEVDLRAGETVDLDQLRSRRISYAQLVRKGASVAAHGVYVLGGGRGAIIDSMGPSITGLVGYGIDLEHISIDARVRYGQSPGRRLGETLVVEHAEVGFGLSAQRFFDLPSLSLGVGLMAELVHHQQRLESNTDLVNRSAIGLVFGALFTLEAVIYGPLHFRLEGGPVTYVFDETTVDAGQETGRKSATPITGFAMTGVGVQF